MASHQNSFALLSDGENDDFSSLLARASAKVESAPPAEKKQNQNKEKNDIPIESANRDDSVIPNERGRGRGYRGERGGRGRGGRRFSSGFDGNEFNRGGRGGYENYQQDSEVFPDSEQGNDYGGNYGVDSNYQGRGRGRGRGRFGGRGRGRGRGGGFYDNQAPPYETEGPAGNCNENQLGEAIDGGWEQVKDFGSRRREDMGMANYDRNDRSFVERRGYSGGYRARGRMNYTRNGAPNNFNGNNETEGYEGNPNENQLGEADGSGWEQAKEFSGRDYRSRREDLPYNEQNDRSFADRQSYSGGYRAREGRQNYARNETPNNFNGNNETEGEKVQNGDIQADITGSQCGDATENVGNAVVEEGKVENVPDVSENKQAEEEAKQMTLEEYEKLLAEKRKPLEALKSVERKVAVDKDFESMQLIEKKKEDSLSVKLKSEEKLKKKESMDKEDKARKSLSINEFLKPADGASGRMGGRGRGRGRGRGERGGRDESFSTRDALSRPTFHIEDPGQFPVLGGAVRA